MGAQGTATLNLGTFPGATDAAVTVTGQTGILSGSLVEAWILPATTADHSADEHWVDPPDVFAGNIVAGAGFTIYGRITSYPEIDDSTNISNKRSGLNSNAPLSYGAWNVGWVWN